MIKYNFRAVLRFSHILSFSQFYHGLHRRERVVYVTYSSSIDDDNNDKMIIFNKINNSSKDSHISIFSLNDKIKKI